MGEQPGVGMQGTGVDRPSQREDSRPGVPEVGDGARSEHDHEELQHGQDSGEHGGLELEVEGRGLDQDQRNPPVPRMCGTEYVSEMGPYKTLEEFWDE
ncbi:hypothetical protein MLD38_011338 [Melastoma candidum]|uniref:Uncharacterized protein n=1 Tax=Melastoma candidum TaxID=119954 RepID=A0ACB9R4H2_9MYRT|nr:hypothetical protein MLD38_011338 [Melastoma candidum]